jgi:hypothetical protein
MSKYTKQNQLPQAKCIKNPEISGKFTHPKGFFFHTDEFYKPTFSDKNNLRQQIVDLSRGERDMLNAVISYDNSFVDIFPSQETIGAKAKPEKPYSRDWMRICGDSLTAKGYIDHKNRNVKEGLYTSNEYDLSILFKNVYLRPYLADVLPALKETPRIYYLLSFSGCYQNKQLDENFALLRNTKKEYTWSDGEWARQYAHMSHSLTKDIDNVIESAPRLRGLPSDPQPGAFTDWSSVIGERPLTPQERPRPFGGSSAMNISIAKPIKGETLSQDQSKQNNESIMTDNKRKPMSKCLLPHCHTELQRKNFYRGNPHHSGFTCEDCKEHRTSSRSTVDKLSTVNRNKAPQRTLAEALADIDVYDEKDRTELPF